MHPSVATTGQHALSYALLLDELSCVRYSHCRPGCLCPLRSARSRSTLMPTPSVDTSANPEIPRRMLNRDLAPPTKTSTRARTKVSFSRARRGRHERISGGSSHHGDCPPARLPDQRREQAQSFDDESGPLADSTPGGLRHNRCWACAENVLHTSATTALPPPMGMWCAQHHEAVCAPRCPVSQQACAIARVLACMREQRK